jgi:hypothetical protein
MLAAVMTQALSSNEAGAFAQNNTINATVTGWNRVNTILFMEFT